MTVLTTSNLDAVRATGTFEDRFKRALRAIRKNGIPFTFNVSACCRGCIDEKALGVIDLDNDTYGYTYGGQGLSIGFNADGIPMYRSSGELAREIYVGHGGPRVQEIADAFRAEGLTVDWDGSDLHAIVINFVE